MASRLTRRGDAPDFQDVLQAAMRILTVDHPHHTLTHLLALKHGNLNAAGKTSRTDRSGMFTHQQDQGRIKKATDLLLYAQNIPSCTPLVKQYESLSGAYIRLAAVEVKPETARCSNWSLTARTVKLWACCIHGEGPGCTDEKDGTLPLLSSAHACLLACLQHAPAC